MLGLDDPPAAALAESLLPSCSGRGDSFEPAELGPVDVLDPVVERMAWPVAGLGPRRVAPRSRRRGEPGRPRPPSTSPRASRRTLRKVRNRLATDGIDSQVTFTRERHRNPAAAAGMALAYRDRDEAAALGSDLEIARPATTWLAMFAARVKALAGQGGMEVATLDLDGELAAYVVGFDDGHVYR